MCGIEKSNKTNIYGTNTEIYLCATEDKYKYSVWRVVYKYSFIILLVGISFVYVILYTFVMREVAKQIKAMAAMKQTASFEVCFSSDSCDPNSVQVVEYNDDNRPRISEEEKLVTTTTQKEPITNGFSSDRKGKHLKESRKPSLKSTKSINSVKSKGPLLRRLHFPYKTIIWFILTVIFIITYITHLILALRVGKVVIMSPMEFSVYSFFFRIYFFNHVVNPLVYAIFVKRFRQSCRTLFPTIKQKISNQFC